MSPPDFDVLARCSPQPVLVLSSSGSILAANEGAGRFLGLKKHRNTLDLLINRSLFDIGIRLIPAQEVASSDLSSLLKLAASRIFRSSARDPRILGLSDYDLHRLDQETTNSFWDEEDELTADREIEVLVSRRAEVSEPQQDEMKRPLPPILARMCVRAFMSAESLFFIVKFYRPGARQPIIQSPSLVGQQRRSSSAFIELPGPAMQRPKEDKSLDSLAMHCAGYLELDGYALYLTQSWYDMTGLTEKDSLGQAWRAAIHPEDVDAMMYSFRCNIANNDEALTYEARYRMRDASYRYFLVRAHALKDEAGNTTKWYYVMMDINDYVVERQTTERQRKSIMNLLSQADVSLWGINRAYDLYIREGGLSWSPPGVEKRAVSTQFIPQSIDGFSDDPEKRCEIQSIIREVLEGRSPIETLEHQVNDRWYRTMFMAELDPNLISTVDKPSVRAVLGLTMDVTDARARTTLQVECGRLIANERAAKESTKLKSQFLANMSHEIRTPIAGVIGLGELLQESVLNVEQRELVNGLQESAGFLLTLINDILDFSKIESGHMDIETVPFRPSRLVRDLRALMEHQAREKGLDLICHNNLTDDITVMGDPGRVRQVLTNLLSNSIKFTKRGSVTLSVSMHSEKSSQGRKNSQGQERRSSRSILQLPRNEAGRECTLQFRVEDTGCGISEASMRKLFRPFSQADPSTARQFGGTGLGLSISKQLVELMGGNITLESNLSLGTAATVEIPYTCTEQRERSAMDPGRFAGAPTTTSPTFSTASLSISYAGSTPCHSDPDTDRGPTTPPTPPTAPQPPLFHAGKPLPERTKSAENRSETHVLIVEDNPINQKIALANIKKLGYSASAVWNGQEALYYLDPCLQDPSAPNIVPDIILMDCMMPVMDGYEATKILRNDFARFSGELRGIPVIAMTASAVSGDKEKCEEAGMDGYLTKPVNKDTLERVIKRWTVQTKPFSLSRLGKEPSEIFS